MKKIRLYALAALFLFALPFAAHATAFIDATGRSLEIENPRCVVSLFGSYGQLWQIAGGTLAATTQDILERQPDEDIVNIGSYTEPNMEAVFALEPDLVILSAKTKAHVQLGELLEEAGICHAYFEVMTWRDYMDALDIMTSLTGRRDLYQAQVEAVQRPIEGMVEAAQGLSGHGERTALLLRASSTQVHAKDSSDTVAGPILNDLGFVNLADGDSPLSENLSMEAILAADPDWIFVTTQGLDSEAAQATIRATLTEHPAWASLSAVQGGRFIMLDPMLFHYRPNDRWAEAYRFVFDLLHEAE